MMVVTETPESDSPVLAPVSYGVPRSRKLAVWASLAAVSAAFWSLMIIGVWALAR